MVTDDSNETQLTTDREMIREWAESYDMIPVQTAETEALSDTSNPYQLHPKDEAEQVDTMEKLRWDDFFQQLDEYGLVVVFYEESADSPLEVIDRDQAVSQVPLEASEVDERLLTGETITSEVTETTVVERTIVEHATIESEIVDTELLDSRIIDVELRSREIGGCDVTGRDVFDEADESRFQDMNLLTKGYQEELPHPAAVEVDVEEDWTVTNELLERVTIESRIIDVDVTEQDEVESETLESTIEIEGVQHSLLESDIIETEADAEEIIQSGTIKSEFHEDDVVRTQLNHRKIVEEQFTEQKVIRGNLTESEILRSETRSSTPIETAFVDGDTLDSDVSLVGVTEYETQTGDGDTMTDEGVRTALSADDEGKPVVDANGQALGMVNEVSGGKAYVDPEPGIVDRIKSKLGWRDADEGDYLLDEDNIKQVTDDEVELSMPK